MSSAVPAAYGDHGVRQLADAVAAGRSTAVSAVEQALARIDAADGRIRAFLEVTPEAALAEARAVDARVAAGRGLRPRAFPWR